MAEGGRGGRILLILFLLGAMGLAGVTAATVVACFGAGWALSPLPELAELVVEPGVEFSLEVPASEETGRDVWLDFELEYELENDPQGESPWGLEGTVTIDEMEFELDVGPGGEGVAGFPSDWESDIYTEEGYIWAESGGEILLGTLPPGGGEGLVAGTIRTRPGTYANGLRLFVRE